MLFTFLIDHPCRFVRPAAAVRPVVRTTVVVRPMSVRPVVVGRPLHIRPVARPSRQRHVAYVGWACNVRVNNCG